MSKHHADVKPSTHRQRRRDETVLSLQETGGFRGAMGLIQMYALCRNSVRGGDSAGSHQAQGPITAHWQQATVGYDWTVCAKCNVTTINGGELLTR